MRTLVFLTLIFLSCRGWAAELPAAHLGESCSEAAEREEQAGRTPEFDLQKMLGTGYLLFSGKADSGEAVQTLYRCSGPQGSVLGYSARRTLPTQAQARAAYERERERVTGRLGPPAADSESMALPQRIRLWRAFGKAYSTMEFVQWKAQDSRSASLTIQKLRADPQWQVVSSDQPAAPEGAARAASDLADQWPQVLAVALSSAAIAAALALTSLGRFAWVVALVTPLAATAAARGLLPWNPARALAAPGAGLAQAGAMLAAALAACALAVWGARRFGSGLAPRAAQPWPHARAMLLAAFVLLAGLGAWLWWQFLPGRDPGNPEEGFAVKWILCLLALLASTALALWGTLRLPRVAGPLEAQRGRRWWQQAPTLAAVGASAALVTLCAHVAVELVFALY
jgi:hypothetical protein